MKAPAKHNRKKTVKNSSVVRKVNIDHAAIAQAKADDLARLHSTLNAPSLEVATKATEMASTPATATPSASTAIHEDELAHPVDNGIAAPAEPPVETMAVAEQPDQSAQPAPPLPDTPEAAEPPIKPEPEPTAKLPDWCQTTGEWQALAEAVVGLAHRDAKIALPCQDAALAQAGSRPLVIACDGAGSAAVSELGSQALTVGLSRLVYTLELQFVQLLDQADPMPDDDFARQMVRSLMRHAKGILQDLAAQHRREVRDFRSTVLLAVVGKKRWLWLKVGDGAVVMERIEQRHTASRSGEMMLSLHPVLCSLGEVGKGEFANQTTFVDDALNMNDVQWDLLPSEGLTGVAVMSDGAAEKLVSNDGQTVAGLTSQWFDLLRQQVLRRRDLTQAFYSERFVKGSTGDDRCVALLSAQVAWPS